MAKTEKIAFILEQVRASLQTGKSLIHKPDSSSNANHNSVVGV